MRFHICGVVLDVEIDSERFIVEVSADKSVSSTSGLGIKFLICGGGNSDLETQYLTLFVRGFSFSFPCEKKVRPVCLLLINILISKFEREIKGKD